MSSPNPFGTPTGVGRGRTMRTPINVQSESPQQPELPTEMEPVAPAVKNREVSIASTSSSARKKKVQLETIRQINDCRRKYLKEIKSHEKSVSILNKQILDTEHYLASMPERTFEKMTDADKTDWIQRQGEIKKAQEDTIWHKGEMKRAHDSMELEVDMINEDGNIDMQLIDLETGDDDQHLSSDDEEKVMQWNAQNQTNSVVIQERNRFLQPGDSIPKVTTQQSALDVRTFAPVPAHQDYGYQQDQDEIARMQYFGLQKDERSKQTINATLTPTTSLAPGATGGSDVISQLVTALGQAFGSGMAQRPQIITKQVDKDLPYFSGKPEDWLVFKNEYERTNEKYEHDDSVKAVRLRKYLKGEARDSVLHLLANPYNVDRIMEVLEERFGKPKHVLNAMIDKVKKLPPPDINKPKTIIDFGTGVDSLVTNIISYKKTDYLNNVQLLKDLVDKLPATMSSEWYRSVLDKGDDCEDLVTFQKWIWKEVRVASERYTPEIKEDEEKKLGVAKKVSVQAVSVEGKGCCVTCGKRNHCIEKCFQFKRMTIDERWTEVKLKKLCFCCLSGDHFTKNCPVQKICGKDGCSSQHHELLHYAKRSWQNSNAHRKTEDTNREVADVDIPPDENNVGTITTAVKVSSATLPIIPVIVKGKKTSHLLYALLDSGASVSMIEKDAAEIIGLDGPSHPFRFTVFENEVKEEKNSKLVKLSVRGNYEAAGSHIMENVHTVNKLGIPGIKVDIDKLKTTYPHLRRMKAKGIINGIPNMIIGYDYFELFSPRVYLESDDKDAPSAYRGKLGWYIREKQDSLNTFFGLKKLDESNDDFLHDAMKEFFTTENFGVLSSSESNRSKDDKKALNLMEENTKLLHNKWETCLIWKDEAVELPESKSMALKRLENMERKMKKDETFMQLCREKFEDYKKKGYLLKKQSICDERKRWFLPWFFAYHPTKKPRLVFDGAAKCSAGLSLNDFLLKGPDLLRPLPAVLMRFRLHQVALTADIKEMFHQVLLREKDRPSQTILFTDENGKLEELEMAVLFFGSAASPSSAIYTKNRNAETFNQNYPVAVRATKMDFYMDDYAGGAETEEEASNLQKELYTIHKSGGFELTKWNSNSVKVLTNIPSDLRSSSNVTFMEKAEHPVEKTLGLRWDPHNDVFQFNVDFKKIPENARNGAKRPTKRLLASIVMSLFDPLGFVAPLKVKALLLIQEVWRTRIGWDDEIPSNVYDQWNSWLKDLDKVKDIVIPRKFSDVSVHNAVAIELHVFCDASKEAFSAVAYLRLEYNGSVKIAFIMGKARVAPIKELSIPRLELQAALMGSRLAKTVKDSFDDDLNILRTVFWTDSMTVLRWLRSTSGRFKEFVSNRVGEILDTTNVAEWRWIPTSLNVADDATRSGKPLDLSSSSRWLLGPNFLQSETTEWPKEDDIVMSNVDNEAMEFRNSIVAVNASLADEPGISFSTDEECGLGTGENLYLPDVANFSSWIRLIRATSARYLALRKFMKLSPDYITTEDQEKAVKLWITKCQDDCFRTEKKCLARGEEISRSSKLFKFSPILLNGIIVMNSRIQNANVAAAVKQPAFLDPNHLYTRLMIHWFHEKSAHFGQERVINELRQHVWILDCRRAVKRDWATCKICSIRKAQCIPPEMGQLPFSRLDAGNSPFFHTGVDYFGPFQVKQGRSLIKRWGVLFSCLTTRAVHLEVAESLDTSDMINALIRFINIRGKPAHIWSDNGTNFVGAEREIREALDGWIQEDINQSLSVRGINWNFIPPSSPHMGGSWERMVGCVKRILYAQLKEQHPKEVVLRTLFAEVTGILNSRPITHASTDPDDLECLTPNHLLNLKCVVGPSLPGVYSVGDRYRKAWRYVQDLSINFWKRWSVEYLPWLAQREKWFKKVNPLTVGDVVIVLEDNAPRNLWKRGIIIDVHPGRDTQVRSVTVKIAHVDPTDKKKIVKYSILKRPTVKVCKLESSCETSVSREGEMSVTE